MIINEWKNLNKNKLNSLEMFIIKVSVLRMQSRVNICIILCSMFSILFITL